MDPIEHFVEAVECYLQQFVEQGSDQELFISGYLHGHFSLALSEQLLAQDRQVSALQANVKRHLEQAFASQELEIHDQNQVFAMWEQACDWYSETNGLGLSQ